MKFSCNRDALASAISAAGRAATSRTGTLPILAGVKLDLAGDRLTVYGTDLELSIETTINVAGELDGATVVPAKLTGDIVRSLAPGTVTIEVSDDTVEIASSRSQFSVRPMPVVDFPKMADLESDPAILTVGDVATGLGQVVRSASNDDARAVLTGVLLSADGDTISMAATDSYRLSVKELAGTNLLADGQRVLIPGRALAELQRLFDNADDKLTVRFGPREAMFELDSSNTILKTRLIEGEYPNWRNLIPAEEKDGLSVDKEAFAEALRRVKILARDSTPVKLTLTAEGVALDAITQDVGNASEFVDGSYSGAPLTVAFNPDYLAAGVDAVEGDQVVMYADSATRPVILRGAGHGDYLYLLMPVRVP